MHIKCIFNAYICKFYAYISHIRYTEVYVMAYFMHIKCIFSAYLLHMLCIFLHVECIFWAYICIFCACNLHICYVQVYTMAYFVHILVCNCILNAYSSSAGPWDGPVPGCLRSALATASYQHSVASKHAHLRAGDEPS